MILLQEEVAVVMGASEFLETEVHLDRLDRLECPENAELQENGDQEEHQVRQGYPETQDQSDHPVLQVNVGSLECLDYLDLQAEVFQKANSGIFVLQS